MRTTLTLLAGLALTVPTLAQLCGTRPPTAQEYARTMALGLPAEALALRSGTTTCIALQAHVVRNNNGTGGISLQELNTGISFLNAVYLDAGISFYWRGQPQYANNSDLYEYNETAPDNDTESALVGLFTTATNAVNIYFVNSITMTGGFTAAGYAYYPSPSATSNRVVMANAYTTADPNGTFAHEFGHYFNLYHTHEGTESGPSAPTAERLARTGPHANCASTGDLLCDTQADPRYSAANFNLAECLYTGSATDNLGTAYTPPVDNTMSYYPDNCVVGLTPQQYSRVMQGVQTRLGHSSYSLNAPPMSVTPASDLEAAWHGGSHVELMWTDNASNEMGYLVERSAVGPDDGFKPLPYGATGPNETDLWDNNISANTTYWYRIKASNGACNTYSNVATVHVGLSYCQPSYYMDCSSGPNVIIDSFGLTGTGSSILNHDSNCAPDGFGDYTAMSCTLTAGSSHAVAMSALVGAGSYYTSRIQIWIDLDQNGDFDGPNESMLSTPGLMDPNFNGSINVPASALNGPTRLRVRCWDTANPCNGPCADCAFGETEEYTVVIQGGTSNGVAMLITAMLGGAYDPASGSMIDSLRVRGLIPLTEPYSALGYPFVGGGGESTTAAALSNPLVPPQNVVDWVVVEARSASNPSVVVRSQAGLLWRNGMVVAPDGTVPFRMSVPDGHYHIAVRHRNHLGAMTASPVNFSGPMGGVANFSSGAISTYGSAGQRSVNGTMVLWPGDVNMDGGVRYTGVGNDRDIILTVIGGSTPTATQQSYHTADTNLDGTVKYTGSGNDRDIILQTVGGSTPTAVRQQQLP